MSFPKEDSGCWSLTKCHEKRPLLWVSTVALIDPDGRVLLAQRPAARAFPGFWEFPGGKMEENELPEDALIRELREELGIETKHACLAPIAFSSYGYESFHALLLVFACRIWQGVPEGKEGQTLAWVRPARLLDHKLLPGSVHAAALLSDFLA